MCTHREEQQLLSHVKIIGGSEANQTYKQIEYFAASQDGIDLRPVLDSFTQGHHRSAINQSIVLMPRVERRALQDLTPPSATNS